MSCCPSAPPSLGASSGISDNATQETAIRPGESVECYAKRVGNTTGLQDDGTGNTLNKIENTSIYVNCQAGTDITFELTDGSTETVTSWVMKDANGVVITNIGGVAFNAGRLHGTFSNGVLGTQIKITIHAMNGANEIDSRAYTFSPAKCSGTNSIQLVNPLPGAVVNSRFGPRMHPVHKIMKMHTGIDMKFTNRSVADVRAAADGEVVFAGPSGSGYGTVVKIKHFNGVGAHLCTTTYNHLAKVYVSVGQKVSANQRIALEGTTGASTGNHLHFECVLPNGTFIDPEPYIRGSLDVARKTLDNGDADPTSIRQRTSTGNAITTENVTAVDNGCPTFGSEYPADPTETNVGVPAAPPTDPFEQAWYFTMQHEVGPAWTTSSPSDPEISAGLINTQAQQKKVGYVNSAGFPGGETKFGIAQGPNPSVRVSSLAYDPAKKTGFNNYWKRGCDTLVSTKPKAAIMLFDMNYLHGVGNTQSYILPSANIGTLSDSLACIALQAAQEKFIKSIVDKNPSRATHAKGWLKRSSDLLQYVQSL